MRYAIPMSRTIRIRPYMGLGNRMLQYMMAEAIRAELPDAQIYGPGLPEWNIPAAAEPPDQAFAVTLRGHSVPLDEMLALCRQVASVDIQIATLSARQSYYLPHRATCQAMFPISSHQPSAGEDELVINLRLAEVVDGAHPNYMPLPIDWYRDLIVITDLNPVFMGQLGDDAYSHALRLAFPDARFIPSNGAMADFDFIARAPNLALPISTFAWLAAWLSPLNRTIHLPVVGLYNPAARPDHDLLPVADPRYRFHIGELHHWSASPQQLAALINGPLTLFPVSGAELVARYPGIGTNGLAGPSWALRGADSARHTA